MVCTYDSGLSIIILMITILNTQVPPGVRLYLVCQAVLHCAGGLRGLVQLPLGHRPQLRAQRHRGGHPQGPEVGHFWFGEK